MIVVACSRCEADVDTDSPHTVLSIRERRPIGIALYAKTLCPGCTVDLQSWWITAVAKKAREGGADAD